MPITLNVGVSKKIGLPNYGSLGASCHLEVELDSSLLMNDLAEFQEKVRKVYAACAQAVNEELGRQRGAGAQGSSRILTAGPAQVENAAVENAAASRPVASTNPPEPNSDTATALNAPAHPNGHERGNGDGQAPSTNGARASAKQIEFLRQLAHQVRGIGLCRLDGISERMCGKPLAELTSLQASALIDAFKAVRDGKLPLDFLNESPT